MKTKQKSTSQSEKRPYDRECCGASNLGFELDYIALGTQTQPVALAVTQDNKFVYAVSTNSTVSVIDVVGASVVANAPTGSNPMGIAMHPTANRAYIANFGDRTIQVFDTTSHNPVGAPIPVQSGSTTIAPASLAVSSDGKRLFVNSDTWNARGGLAWIDLALSATHIIDAPSTSVSLIAGMPFRRSPYSTATSALGAQQFFAAHRVLLTQREVRLADTGNNTFVSFQVELIPCALLQHGDTLIVTGYKTNGPDAEDLGIDVFRQSDMKRLKHIDAPGLAKQLMPGDPIPYEGFGFSLRAAALNPTCRELWYGNPTDGLSVGHVGIVELDTGQFRTFAVEDCNGIAFTTDGRHAFLSDTRNDRVIRVIAN